MSERTGDNHISMILELINFSQKNKLSFGHKLFVKSCPKGLTKSTCITNDDTLRSQRDLMVNSAFEKKRWVVIYVYGKGYPLLFTLNL